MVQVGHVPAKVIFAFGSSVVSDDAPDTDAQVSVESISEIVMVVPFKEVSSFVDLSVTSAIVGASFTAITDRAKGEDAVSVPSLTINETLTNPLAFAVGVMVPVQLGAVPLHTTAPVDGTTDVLSVVYIKLVPLQLNALSKSAIVKFTPRAVSSFVILVVIALIEGASLTGFTVRTKVSVLFNVPSVTVKVTVADPF